MRRAAAAERAPGRAPLRQQNSENPAFRKESNAMQKRTRTSVSGRKAKSFSRNREDAVAIQYLLVLFDEDRGVRADGDSVGVTNHTLMLPADEYIITLEGDGYAPASQDVPLVGTSIMRPKVVQFTKAG
jgi:hypothetical protein